MELQDLTNMYQQEQEECLWDCILRMLNKEQMENKFGQGRVYWFGSTLQGERI